MLKNFKLYILLLFSTVTIYSNAQESKSKFSGAGITAGFSGLVAEFDNEFEFLSGFQLGVLAEFDIEKSQLQGQFLYSRHEEESELLHITILGKYALENFKKLQLQGGLNFNWMLIDKIEELSRFGIGIAGGTSYDINENLSASLLLSYNVTDTATDEDIEFKNNFLNLGLIYKFSFK